MFRRLTALLMMFGVVFSSAETVTGELRDGAVHHESTAEAAAHSDLTHGDHGHEDASSHGPDHEHGTPTDHCTHQHGAPLNATRIALAVVPRAVSTSFPEPSPWLGHFTEPSFRPPQA